MPTRSGQGTGLLRAAQWPTKRAAPERKGRMPRGDVPDAPAICIYAGRERIAAVGHVLVELTRLMPRARIQLCGDLLAGSLGRLEDDARGRPRAMTLAAELCRMRILSVDQKTTIRPVPPTGSEVTCDSSKRSICPRQGGRADTPHRAAWHMPGRSLTSIGAFRGSRRAP